MKIKIKNMRKILIILSLLIICINILSSTVLGFDTSDYKPGTVTKSDAKNITDKAGVILGAVRNVGVVVSVITLMLIGVKYMFGSVEERADYKKTLGPYFIGFIFMMSITSIVSFIYKSIT